MQANEKRKKQKNQLQSTYKWILGKETRIHKVGLNTGNLPKS